MIKTTKEIKNLMYSGTPESISTKGYIQFINKLWVDCESAEKTLQSRLAKASQQEIKLLRYIQEQCQVGGNVMAIYDTCEERIKQLKGETNENKQRS